MCKITGTSSANASTPRMLYWATYCHWISACRSVFLEPSLIACKYAPFFSFWCVCSFLFRIRMPCVVAPYEMWCRLLREGSTKLAKRVPSHRHLPYSEHLAALHAKSLLYRIVVDDIKLLAAITLFLFALHTHQTQTQAHRLRDRHRGPRLEHQPAYIA